MAVVGASVLAMIGLLVGGALDEIVRDAEAGHPGWVARRPHCPDCATTLTGRLRIPLVWAAGPRRCPACGAGLGLRRWWLGAVTGAACAWMAIGVGLTWALPAFEVLAVTCVVLATIDITVRRVPDRLLMPAYAAFGGLLLIAAAAGGQWADLARAISGGLVAFGLYLVLALAGGLGMGDVKLALLLGTALAWLGWDAWLVGITAAPVLAALWVAIAGRRRPRAGSTIAFAPFMATAALLAVPAGSQLVALYLDLRARG